MQFEGVDQRLRLVRHQLDMLSEARMISGFAPEDEVQYRELCQIERRLLAAIAA